MLQHVPDHHGVEQAVEVLHRGLGIEVEVFQEWESTQDEIVLEEFPGFGHWKRRVGGAARRTP